jgi:uncharacterized membrane protein YbaN (DUF454 family)
VTKSKLRTTGGYVLIGLGVIGVLIPVVPQVPFFVAGAALLGRDHKLVKGARNWLHKRGFKIFKEEPESESAANSRD